MYEYKFMLSGHFQRRCCILFHVPMHVCVPPLATYLELVTVHLKFIIWVGENAQQLWAFAAFEEDPG